MRFLSLSTWLLFSLKTNPKRKNIETLTKTITWQNGSTRGRGCSTSEEARRMMMWMWTRSIAIRMRSWRRWPRWRWRETRERRRAGCKGSGRGWGRWWFRCWLWRFRWIEAIRAKRLKELKAKKARRNRNKAIGEYREIVESEFLPTVTKHKFAAVHFYHREFERCKIMDQETSTRGVQARRGQVRETERRRHLLSRSFRFVLYPLWCSSSTV